jgi:hypothetical protein
MASELFASSEDSFGPAIGKLARGGGGGGGSFGAGSGGGGGAASPERRLWFLALHARGPLDPPAATDGEKQAAAAASLGAPSSLGWEGGGEPAGWRVGSLMGRGRCQSPAQRQGAARRALGLAVIAGGLCKS